MALSRQHCWHQSGSPPAAWRLLLLHEHFYATPAQKLKACPSTAALKFKAKPASAEKTVSLNGTSWEDLDACSDGAGMLENLCKLMPKVNLFRCRKKIPWRTLAVSEIGESLRPQIHNIVPLTTTEYIHVEKPDHFLTILPLMSTGFLTSGDKISRGPSLILLINTTCRDSPSCNISPHHLSGGFVSYNST